MDAAHLQRRILVVLVTTRAAADSLGTDGHSRAAVERGIRLLDGMVDEVAADGSVETTEQLDQARRELTSLLEGTSP